MAGSSVYGRIGIVCKPVPWTINLVNADYDYGQSAEPHTGNQHDRADDQDEDGIAVRHENHFLSDVLRKPVAMTLGNAHTSAQ
jgi:hypothetical protein